MFKLIDGNKTYIGLLVMGALGLMFGQGWIEQSTFVTLEAVVGTWSGIAFRHAVKKAER